MEKKIFILFLATVFCTQLEAQRNEFGVFLGSSYYLGDLNPDHHFALAKPAGGLIYRYNFNTRWTFKFTGLYGNIEASDKETNNKNPRNLSFRSRILEFSPQLELNFLPYFTGSNKQRFSPYIFAGVALFHFNPEAELNGEWHELQPLGTEGQTTTKYPDRKLYRRAQISFPFGLGFKISLSKSICLGLEWGMRKTLTDYIDDVSLTYVEWDLLYFENDPISAALSDRSIVKHEAGTARGNSQTKDWYSFAGITFTFIIFRDMGRNCPAFRHFYNYDNFLYY